MKQVVIIGLVLVLAVVLSLAVATGGNAGHGPARATDGAARAAGRAAPADAGTMEPRAWAPVVVRCYPESVCPTPLPPDP